jgi:hypothetical protein
VFAYSRTKVRYSLEQSFAIPWKTLTFSKMNYNFGTFAIKAMFSVKEEFREGASNLKVWQNRLTVFAV